MSLLKIKGFIPYLAIAFLNASVDLAHKITIQNVLLKSFEGTTLITLTALINAMILLPFIFLFSPSGFINDKYSHTKVIRLSSIAAVFITLAIFFSYLFGAFELAFLLTLILATQSAVYSPAKYSIIKSIVGTENLGRANGIIQALTIVAILFSSFAFSFIFEHFYVAGSSTSDILANMYIIGFALVAFSLLEAFFAFKIPFYPRSNNDENVEHFNIKRYITLTYLKQNLSIVRENKNIWLSIIGLSVFWGVSQVIVAAFPAHYKAIFADDNAMIIQGILAVSGIGLIIGSTIAGAMSKQHIEHGIIPIGGLGVFIAIFIMATTSNLMLMLISSFLFGLFGGLFIVPLNATIQFFAPQRMSGKIMAGNNFIQNVTMVAFLLLSIVFVTTHISTRGLLLFTAIVCLIGSCYAILQLPHLFTRLLLLPLLKTGYRFNVDGLKNLPQSGGVLLLGNHISWIDWLVLQAASPRAIKFVMFRGIYNKWYLKWFLKIFNVIPIGAGSSKESIHQIRKLLANGEVVALFPEGHISYNGQINEFQRGYELALQDLDNICIVPFYLRGLWGSSFSRAEQHYKSLSKNGKRDILVAFGKPIYQFTDRVAMKQKVVELSFSAWERFISHQQPLTHQWIDTAKNNLFKTCSVDSMGMNLTNAKFITAVLVFKQLFKQLLHSEKHIGVLLPSSSIGAIVNMALFISGKVPVNLNYTLSEQSMAMALKKANITQVISSEKFIEKLCNKGFDYKNLLADKLISVEQVSQKVTKFSKTMAFVTALLAPTWLIKLIHFNHQINLDDTAVILFSSGSEGEPKGIELTHKNLLTNIKQISELLNFKRSDVILNSLPIFHSFGLTVTTLLPLCTGIKMISVPDPTDAPLVGKMTARHNATILFGTSTFFRFYIRNRKLHPLMFQSVRMVVAGAEKLKEEVKEGFRMKFGLDIYEGYGTTETAPVAAVNMPNILERDTLKEMMFNKAGSVGMPLPGTVIKIVDPDSLQPLATGEDGLILIGGGQVMKGYLNDPEKTADVIVEIDGVRYYKTGDKGHIDEQGFITIVDRYSRFAKIGGEMISLGSVEEQIAKILHHEHELQFVAVNVPDEKKGEAVVLLIKTEHSLEDIEQQLKSSILPPLMQPNAIYAVDEIPTLASGKIDFKGAKTLAMSLHHH